MNPIQTNQITYKLNKESLNKDYDIFSIATTKPYFHYSSHIIDDALLNNNVCSVLYKKGHIFYILMHKDINNISSLKTVLSQSKDFETITMKKESLNMISDDIILQLLFNAIKHPKDKRLRYNNLTGHLYCYHPQWLKKSKKDNTIYTIPCLEIKISPQFHLNIDVKTFTSTKLKKHIEFKKRKFEDYPKYVLTKNNTLRRQNKTDKEETYILRHMKNKKTEIPFLNIQDIHYFHQSKMGILNSIIEEFNDTYALYCHISFQEITQYQSLDYTSSIAKENKNVIKNLLNQKKIKIVDGINDEYSKDYCYAIANLLLEKYDIHVKVGKNLSKNNLNIKVIHEANYYQDIEDPHKNFIDTAVQHITVENFKEQDVFAISTVIHELLIKDDLKNKKITLFDWQSLNYDQDLDFIIEVENENYSDYLVMNIHPDGTFDISKHIFNLFETDQYEECINIFENAKINSEKIQGIIRDSHNHILIIKDTGWFTIPEIHKIHKELSNGNTKLRSKIKRDELLSSCLDIKKFQKDNELYYFVGTIGNGMRRSLHRAANIRKIESYKHSQLSFNDLLPLMNVTFVHNGQLTIIPFPFKYLREYMKQT